MVVNRESIAAGPRSRCLFIARLCTPATTLAAVFHLVPNLGPLLSPLKWPPANDANFGRLGTRF